MCGSGVDLTRIRSLLPLGFLLLLAGPALLAAATGGTGSLTLTSSTLPSGRNDHAAVASSTHVYFFGGGAFLPGGDHGAFDQIVRYDPATGQVVVMNATLPTPRSYVSAVWANGSAYVFGGCNDGSQCRVSPVADVVKYNPATGNVSVVASLPSGRVATSAVWTGRYAYVFGGDSCDPSGNCILSQIVRFDPLNNSVAVMNATIPDGSLAAAATFDGTHAYIFGGLVDGVFATDRILRYTPATDTLTTLNATLPTENYWLTAAHSGNRSYVIGGRDAGFVDDVWAFDPATHNGSYLPNATFTTGRYTPAVATFVDGDIYIGGGWDGTTRLDEIWRLDLVDMRPPTAPAGVTVQRQAYPSKADVSWNASSSPTPLSGYRVWRSDNGGGYHQVGAVNATTLTFSDTTVATCGTYDYQVEAYNAYATGPRSAAVRTTHAPTLNVICGTP